MHTPFARYARTAVIILRWNLIRSRSLMTLFHVDLVPINSFLAIIPVLYGFSCHILLSLFIPLVTGSHHLKLSTVVFSCSVLVIVFNFDVIWTSATNAGNGSVTANLFFV